MQQAINIQTLPTRQTPPRAKQPRAIVLLQTRYSSCNIGGSSFLLLYTTLATTGPFANLSKVAKISIYSTTSLAAAISLWQLLSLLAAPIEQLAFLQQAPTG
jgi:hypothetical protein